MSFAYYQQIPVSINFGDPGADDKKIFLIKAREAMRIESAYVTVTTAQGTSKGAEMALHVYDSAGTGLMGTAAAGIGGSAVADAIPANTPTAWTISDANLEAGEWLVLDYQEEGDYPGGLTSVFVQLVPGQE